jgi:hypothetical protein
MDDQALLHWLLEPENASVRYHALRDLLNRAETDAQVAGARAAIVEMPQVRAVLNAQYPAGYWIKPDRGYSPRHKATIWQLILLADVGAARTEAIARACEHVLAVALRPGQGLFSAHKHSTGTFPCLNGDLLRVLWHFGYGDHPAVAALDETLARFVLANDWACVRNSVRARDRTAWHPCVWGCVKVLRGFAALPVAQRSSDVCRAIASGVAFLLAHDLAEDLFPAMVDVPSHWLHFGFPLGYGSDLLEALLALAELDVVVSQPRALQAVLDRRDTTGRWALEHALSNAWATFGREGEPNKWVTLRDSVRAALSHQRDLRAVSLPGDDLTDRPRWAFWKRIGQRVDRPPGILRRQEQDHAYAHVENAVHL